MFYNSLASTPILASLFILLSMIACTGPTSSSATNSQSNNTSIIFNGICDGSAVVKLDNNTVLVAYDELNTLFAYDVRGGMPVASADLTAMLKLSTSDEIDIEAATVHGQKIWWIGSHSLDKKGLTAPNRQSLFATNLPSASLSDLKILNDPVNLSTVLMESAMLAPSLTKAATNRLPKQGGINIEGLAATAANGLLVGFRSPLTGINGLTGDALVARIVPEGESFEVQQVYFLDLADRGIRDIVNAGSGYLIVAGPVASAGEYALYSWDGQSDPQRLTIMTSLNAEGLVEMDNFWLLLSDDGKLKRQDDEASDDYRTCDRIRKKHSSAGEHPGVFFRAEKISKKKFP